MSLRVVLSVNHTDMIIVIIGKGLMNSYFSYHKKGKQKAVDHPGNYTVLRLKHFLTFELGDFIIIISSAIIFSCGLYVL